MNYDETWERWKQAQREVRPPVGLADRVLAQLGPAPIAQPARRSRFWPAVVCAAAAVVCAVRLGSVLEFVLAPSVEASSDATVVAAKDVKDLKHVEPGSQGS